MSDVQGRIPPQNIEAEQIVLGGILVNGSFLDRLSDILEPIHFYKEAHRIIYQEMIELQGRGEPVDLITLTNKLEEKDLFSRVGGVGYIASLSDRVSSTENLTHYAKIIKEKAFFRSLIDEAASLVEKAYKGEEDVDQFLAVNLKAINQLGDTRGAKKVFPVAEVARTCFAEIEERYKRKQPFTGLKTGFPDFDRLTAGLQKSDLIILAARPGMGKTSFALNIASYVALNNHEPALVFSCEMSKEQLVLRVISGVGQINAKNLKTGMLADSEFQHLINALGRISEGKLFIDDTAGIRLSELVMRSRRLKREQGLSLIIIDYLQLIRLDPYLQKRNQPREQEIAEISRTMKELAKELKVPVIALSQLNRELEKRGEKERRPRLSDLRESGSLEQDADLIAFLYRDAYYNKSAVDPELSELLIEKHRNGAMGKIDLRFKGEFTKFESVAPTFYDE